MPGTDKRKFGRSELTGRTGHRNRSSRVRGGAASLEGAPRLPPHPRPDRSDRARTIRGARSIVARAPKALRGNNFGSAIGHNWAGGVVPDKATPP